MSSRRIGSYQITDYVGSGGFGSVFKAEDANTPGRVVAIKELHKKHTKNQVIKQRFFQEAVAMARLDHPNLPRLYTFGEDNGSYYLVMEFISGKLLSDEIHETGPLRPDRAITVLTQVLDAVSYAHRNGIIHRDLKPDNIMLVGGAGSIRIKVLDFGIARMVGGESLTLAGEGFGTPTYMSPERMSGAAGDDPRMDLYAAGIILFEMLTGKAPFESKASDPAEYWVEMRELHLREPLPALAPLGVPAEVERIALRATAKRLEDRYQAADEMLSDVRGLGQSSSDAPTVVLASARLLVSTTPAGAEVYVDDVRRGTSDATRGRLMIDGLAAGVHSVRVLKEGFNEYRISVALEEGRQTDLQVAVPARATVAMPPGESTAAGGLETVKFQGSDDVQTAVLTLESLPAGTALFIGSRPVGSAGEDGRATLKLSPGEYEIRAASPAGEVGARRVTVTAQTAASGMTMTVPLAQTTIAGASAPRPEPSGRGKQLAAAAVVILLLALVAAAYFVLRGPDRARESESISTPAAAAPGPAPASSTASQQPDSQPNEDNRKAAEAKRQNEQDAQKKATENPVKAEAKEPSQAATETTKPLAPAPAAPADTVPPPAATAKDGCVLVTVQDADGQPVQGAKVGLMDESGKARSAGRTGPNGHWRQCGLATGSTVRVAAFGPLGMINPQTAVVMQRTFITIRVPKRVDDPNMPDRPRPPFRRRP